MRDALATASGSWVTARVCKDAAAGQDVRGCLLCTCGEFRSVAGQIRLICPVLKAGRIGQARNEEERPRGCDSSGLVLLFVVDVFVIKRSTHTRTHTRALGSSVSGRARECPLIEPGRRSCHIKNKQERERNEIINKEKTII